MRVVALSAGEKCATSKYSSRGITLGKRPIFAIGGKRFYPSTLLQKNKQTNKQKHG